MSGEEEQKDRGLELRGAAVQRDPLRLRLEAAVCRGEEEDQELSRAAVCRVQSTPVRLRLEAAVCQGEDQGDSTRHR